jgi:hypothetical protein
MSYFRSDALTLPVAALEMVLRRAIRLEILFLHQIKLHGSAFDFEHALPKSLQGHPSLKRVNLHCCGAAVSDSGVAANLDPLVCALAALPTMYYLSLDQAPITSVSVRALAESSSLKDISFYNMPVIKPSLNILVEALQGTNQEGQKQSTSQLQGLRIRSCSLDCTDASSIASMMESNSTLESLVFYCDRWNDYGPSLARSLEKNTTLKRLEVGIGKSGKNSESLDSTMPDMNELHKNAAMDISNALKDNADTSLRHLCLCLSNGKGGELYQAYMEPFEHMLETNYTLQSFLLQGENSFSTISPNAAFLMKLNQRSVLDRRRLFQGKQIMKRMQNSRDTNAEEDPWIESLIQHQGDLSILFYLLSRNPSLLVSSIPS